MQGRLPFFLCLFICTSLFSHSIPMLYQKNHLEATSHVEKLMVDHARTSVENALKMRSKLCDRIFNESEASKQWRHSVLPHYHALNDITQIEYYHLLNNLCNLKNATHLHVGLLAGDSYIASLYGNQWELKEQIGVDWFMECPETIFKENCGLFLDSHKYHILHSGCFEVDKSTFTSPINIYFYDADHSLMGHEKALTYYNDIFADIFIVVIDDWNCPWIRIATFKAFSELNYHTLYETFVHSIKINSDQYIAVIRK